MFDARRLSAGLIMPQSTKNTQMELVLSSLYANARNKSRLTAGFCIGSAPSYHPRFLDTKGGMVALRLHKT